MSRLNRTSVTLRFSAPGLEAEEITDALGVAPTKVSPGHWRLRVAAREPGDLNAQINELLSQTTREPAVWAHLTTKFSADVFCGLFMDRANEGCVLKPETLAALAERGLSLSLDIYDHSLG